VATRHSTEAGRAKTIPAGADHYKVELPADFKVPDGLTFKLDDKDPMVAFGREFAASQKLTQTEFASLIGKYAAVQMQQAQAAHRALLMKIKRSPLTSRSSVRRRKSALRPSKISSRRTAGRLVPRLERS
jgi:hypothetical protein